MRLGIRTPCSESWDGMTLAPGGRHCAHCNKVVVDLSECTEDEAFERVVGKGPKCVRLRLDSAGSPIFVGAAIAGAMALTVSCDRAPSGVSGSESTGVANATSDSTVGTCTTTGAGSIPTTYSQGIAVPGAVALDLDAADAARVARAEIMRREQWSPPFLIDVTEEARGWRAIVRRAESFDANAAPVSNSAEHRRLLISRMGEILEYECREQ